MFNYPEKTETNKTFKINELLKLLNVDKETKKDSTIIESIKLSNILSSETTSFSANENCDEIYIIDIVVKEKTLPLLFLNAFNKDINFQTLFRIFYKNEVNYYTSLKIIEKESVKVLKTFESGWKDQELDEMPNADYLEDVFKVMVAKISKVNFKNQESVQDYIQRLTKINRRKKEIEKLERSMLTEKQPNLKMELNDKLKLLKLELQGLIK